MVLHREKYTATKQESDLPQIIFSKPTALSANNVKVEPTPSSTGMLHENATNKSQFHGPADIKSERFTSGAEVTSRIPIENDRLRRMKAKATNLQRQGWNRTLTTQGVLGFRSMAMPLLKIQLPSLLMTLVRSTTYLQENKWIK
jgi:cell division septum initiation protein DivIVA